jgi:hypothetical protein
MSEPAKRKKALRRVRMHRKTLTVIAFSAVVVGIPVLLMQVNLFAVTYTRAVAGISGQSDPVWPASLDKHAYNEKMLALAHYVAPQAPTSTTTPPAAQPVSTATTSVSVAGHLWPPKAVYPEGGAILPFHRIVAYYGNFYSKQMGVLGEYPEDRMLAMLASTTAQWEAADPSTPVIPAIQYIAVVAQAAPGPRGLYRAEMSDDQIDKALALANQIHGILILDIQVGKSTLQAELPELKKYLALPNVELAIDPEFSMKYGNAPGTVIGTFSASDINYAANFLATFVRVYKLPPKVLVVQRFTYDMVTNVQNIKPLPEVEVVMDMDGWGSQAKKIGTYNAIVAAYPTQFTGLKLFYKNDVKPPSTGMLTPAQVLSLTPAPIYIQYQ